MFEDRTVIEVPWNRASVLHRKGQGHFLNPNGIRAEAEKIDIPLEIIEARKAKLPAPVRRTSRQRTEALATQLFEMGMNSQRVYGYPMWPDSLTRVLVSLGAQDKGLYEQVEALVGHFIIKSEHQQKEKDQKAVTLGWHGHYD